LATDVYLKPSSLSASFSNSLEVTLGEVVIALSGDLVLALYGSSDETMALPSPGCEAQQFRVYRKGGSEWSADGDAVIGSGQGLWSADRAVCLLQVQPTTITFTEADILHADVAIRPADIVNHAYYAVQGAQASFNSVLKQFLKTIDVRCALVPAPVPSDILARQQDRPFVVKAQVRFEQSFHSRTIPHHSSHPRTLAPSHPRRFSARE
jgi:hypothetical protein